ncbi:hypothetical protein SAMN02745702_01991 [Desulfobaculum bizertense DSM 18034]|uniref:Uncharacterized protein n=1 Tax=Desulfobaculum bizertense DSM 18034 TaxID=1121442 RepID=A0A1T4WBJ7_9BACT|nr:hypothetical protein SAMN02745702_01991 [Desulfobaculum bizertense DSM 18034]
MLEVYDEIRFNKGEDYGVFWPDFSHYSGSVNFSCWPKPLENDFRGNHAQRDGNRDEFFDQSAG